MAVNKVLVAVIAAVAIVVALGAVVAVILNQDTGLPSENDLMGVYCFDSGTCVMIDSTTGEPIEQTRVELSMEKGTEILSMSNLGDSVRVNYRGQGVNDFILTTKLTFGAMEMTFGAETVFAFQLSVDYDSGGFVLTGMSETSKIEMHLSKV